MRIVEFAAVVAALTLAGAARAQSVGGPAPAAPPPPGPPEMRGPDDRVTDFNRMRDDVSGRRAARPDRRAPCRRAPRTS